MNYRNIRARARENLRGHWGVSIAATFVATIFGALVAGSGFSLRIGTDILQELPRTFVTVFLAIVSVSSALSLVSFVLGGVVQLGYSKFLLAQHDGETYDVKDLFSQFDRFTVGFLQKFLCSLFIFLWSLLLIVPGFIKTLSYSMTPFILADHPELTAKQAIRRSMELMDGHKTDLFCLSLSFIGWSFLCVLTMGIGLLWLNPYMNAAYAAFYREITVKKQETYVEF